MSAPWLEGANEEQRAAILHQNGPAKLLAVAGSGKTFVAIGRILRLIAEGVDSKRVLAITFSKKAADEMVGRAQKFGAKSVRIGTWHSVTLEILRTDGHASSSWEKGEPPRHFLKNVLGYRGMDWKDADTNKVAIFISKCKACLETPESTCASARAKKMFGEEWERALEAFSRYNNYLEENEFLSFDDYLVFAGDHLESDRDVLARWQTRWDYIIQDEVQDSNPAQKRLIRLLAGGHRNYFAVGDPMQAIFAFRESHPRDLVRFEDDWPDAASYTLPKNYRCARAIIAAANAVLSHARIDDYRPGKLVAVRSEEGSVRVLEFETFDDEADSFASYVADMTRTRGMSYESFCVLFRTNAQSRAHEEALLRHAIPYSVVGGGSFYERRENDQLLAYLRLAARRGGFDDVDRSIHAPFRYLGKALVESFKDAARASRGAKRPSSWVQVVRAVCKREGVEIWQQEAAQEWAAIGADLRTAVEAGDRPDDILERLLERTSFIDWLTKEEGKDTLEISPGANVHELVRVAGQFDTVGEFLDHVDTTILESQKQRMARGDRVQLMNVHRSKALEFDHVWISGFNETIFPHPLGDAEEERRLAYVAMTRAKDELVLSHVSSMATKYGVRDAFPSRFIAEATASRE